MACLVLDNLTLESVVYIISPPKYGYADMPDC